MDMVWNDYETHPITSALSKSLEITNMHVQGVSWILSNNGGIFD